MVWDVTYVCMNNFFHYEIFSLIIGNLSRTILRGKWCPKIVIKKPKYLYLNGKLTDLFSGVSTNSYEFLLKKFVPLEHFCVMCSRNWDFHKNIFGDCDDKVSTQILTQFCQLSMKAAEGAFKKPEELKFFRIFAVLV